MNSRMGNLAYPLETHFTDKALRFIRAARMQNPQVLVNLEYYRPVSGGCCGGGMGDPVPIAKARLVDNLNPREGFMKIETKEGIPIYIANAIYESATKSGSLLIIDLGGFIRRSLKIEGLNLNHLAGNNTKQRSGCH